MSMKENAEVLLLRQTILEAIKENNLTERMSMIKMRAAAVNMSDDDLTALIDEINALAKEKGYSAIQGLETATEKQLAATLKKLQAAQNKAG